MDRLDVASLGRELLAFEPLLGKRLFSQDEHEATSLKEAGLPIARCPLQLLPIGHRLLHRFVLPKQWLR